ncbi:hypothetical protein HDV04_005044 [Boothiomyces sp. JEL0838]|nr:hypothetical protein HDV04_005044 [Boothiomyces sp. JEL0838]
MNSTDSASPTTTSAPQAAILCCCCKTKDRKRGAPVPVPQRKINDDLEQKQIAFTKLDTTVETEKPYVPSESKSLPRPSPHTIPKTHSLPRMRNSDDIKTLQDTLSRLSHKNHSGNLEELTLPRSSFGSKDHIPVKIDPQEAYEIQNIYELRKFDVEHVEYNQDRTSRQVSFVGSSAESDGGFSFIDSEI